MKKILYTGIAVMLAAACGTQDDMDAQGRFEAKETVVSSEATGRILCFDVEEGEVIDKGPAVGAIDSMQLHLQRKQLKAQLSALLQSRPDIKAQAASLKEQIEKQKSERTRLENMLKEGAATQKQMDDINAQIRILESQLAATLSTLDKSTSTINGNVAALEAQIEALDDLIAKCRIVSPAKGTVMVKYAEAGEVTAAGRPLMKIADMEDIFLRAYFTSDQLARIKTGDTVDVTADFGAEQRYHYKGCIRWISSESEFTPKSIQTKDSRANLVYAVKIAVRNDGRLKTGLTGEVRLRDESR